MKKKVKRDDMFERVRAAKTYISTVNNPEQQAELELAAFMSIFHPERKIEKGTRKIKRRSGPDRS